jgi:hypothetical protein
MRPEKVAKIPADLDRSYPVAFDEGPELVKYEANREEGETVVLMATGGPGVRSKDGTVFYKIEQGATIDCRGRLPVEQLVDPLDAFYEEHLYFSRYDR